MEFLEWLRKEAPGPLRLLPVLAMSSSDLAEDVERAYALGVNSYLVKAVDWTTFRKRIKSLKRYWGQHVATPPVTTRGSLRAVR